MQEATYNSNNTKLVTLNCGDDDLLEVTFIALAKAESAASSQVGPFGQPLETVPARLLRRKTIAS